jgi:molybdopterin biosynthesis enzyme MoaB
VRKLKAWIADGPIDVVISTGGTGVTSTIQSRATGGVAGGTYLFALPGSPGALPRRLGRYSQVAARQPLPALQPGRADAAAAGRLQKHRRRE